jgi:hypothetical protein
MDQVYEDAETCSSSTLAALSCNNGFLDSSGNCVNNCPDGYYGVRTYTDMSIQSSTTSTCFSMI